MTDETREQDLVGKYFGANRNADDRTMKQACERLKSDAYAQGLAEGRRQAIEECIEFLRKDQNENYHGWVGGQLQYYEQELEKLKGK